jgi:hypothetical protein
MANLAGIRPAVKNEMIRSRRFARRNFDEDGSRGEGG